MLTKKRGIMPIDKTGNLYLVLGITPDASMQEVNDAYKKLALKFHPDHNGGSQDSSERFKKISFAHEILSDYHKRKQYDQQQEESAPRENPASREIFGMQEMFGRMFGNFDFFDDDIEEWTNPKKGVIYSQSKSYQRGPDGKVVQEESINTNMHGKPEQYHHKIVKDRKGRIIDENGAPIPYQKFMDRTKQIESTVERSRRSRNK